MKAYYYIAVMAMSFTMVACSNEDEALTYNISDIIQIQPSIGGPLMTRTTPQSTDATEQTQFCDGDEIQVGEIINKNTTFFYKYICANLTDYGVSYNVWTPDPNSTSYLTWKSSSVNLCAYYPVTATTNLTEFILPGDQSSAEKIKQADYMTCQAVTCSSSSGNYVANLTMNRHTARVRVILDGFGDQFKEGTYCLVHIKSPYSNIKIEENADANAEKKYIEKGEGGSKLVAPLTITADKKSKSAVELSTKGDNATALVVPSEEMSDEVFIDVWVYDGGAANSKQQLFVHGIPKHEAGYSYDYNLTVGKDQIFINSVTVTPWTEETVVKDENGNELFEAGVLNIEEQVDKAGNTYYDVYNANGLLEWREKYAVSSADLHLKADIDMTGQKWTPLDTYSGEIFGADHTIIGLTIDVPQDNNAAFIKELQGKVRCLKFDKVNISRSDLFVSSAKVAVVAAINKGEIADCSVLSGKVDITTTGTTGGIVGENQGKITNCTNNASVTALTGDGTGGIAGSNVGANAIVMGCTNTGDVKATKSENETVVNGSNAGGVVGILKSGSVITCCNSGNVSGEKQEYVGGIVGCIEGDAAKVVGSYTIDTNEYTSDDGANVTEKDGVGSEPSTGKSQDVMGCYSFSTVSDVTKDKVDVMNNKIIEIVVDGLYYYWKYDDGEWPKMQSGYAGD